MAKRVFSVATLVLSIVVLLLSLGGIVGAWVTNRAATTATQNLLAGIDRTAGTLRLGVARVDAGLTRIDDLVASVETATTQLGENIADKGLVMTLLPEQKEQDLAGAVQGVTETFANLREVLEAGFGLYQAVDSMPFVSLPKPDQARLQAAGEAVDRLGGEVQGLRAEIAAVRSGAAAKVLKLTGAAAAVRAELDQVRTRLAQVDAELAAVQARAAQLQERVSVVFLIVSCLATLLLAWVAYSQVVLVRLAWADLRKPKPAGESGASPAGAVSAEGL